MAQQTYTKAEKFAEWEEQGEDAVRTAFNLGLFSGPKKALAKMWLEAKDQIRADELENRKQETSSESLRIARSAKNAAWLAAVMATIAAIVAIVSAVIAYLALQGGQI